MNYKSVLRGYGESASMSKIDALALRACERGQLWELGRALLSVSSFGAGNHLANDRVLRVLIRSGLRREALRLVNESEFSGKAGCLLRLKQLLPTSLDRGDE